MRCVAVGNYGKESWTIKKDEEAIFNAFHGIMDCKKDKRVGLGDCWSRMESARIDQTEEDFMVRAEWRLNGGRRSSKAQFIDQELKEDLK